MNVPRGTSWRWAWVVLAVALSLIVLSTLGLGNALLVAATLSFLGLGGPATDPRVGGTDGSPPSPAWRSCAR